LSFGNKSDILSIIFIKTFQGGNMSNSTINPYLAFKGNCRDAMEFYKTALGGELEIMDFSSAPMEVPDDYKSKVLHSKLTFANATIMASDTMPGNEINFGDNISVAIGADSEQIGEIYFNNLAEGGKILMPFENAFWGSKFGMLEDKFGVRWMVDCSNSEMVLDK
jgi:PhnB protein